jgi:hypothetical protein
MQVDTTLIKNERYTQSQLVYQYIPTGRRNVWLIKEKVGRPTYMKTEQAWIGFTLLLQLIMIIGLLDTSCRHSVLKSLRKDRPRFVVAVDLYFIH